MDGGVGGAQLHHLRAGGGDKAAIAGAASGGQFGVQLGDIADGTDGRVHQGAAVGEKRLA